MNLTKYLVLFLICVAVAGLTIREITMSGTNYREADAAVIG